MHALSLAGAAALAAATLVPAAAAQTDAEREALFWQRRADAQQHYTQADVDFMTGMIGHHAQALVMSRLAPTNGASPAVRTLAARIINAQQDEIATMQRWLEDRGQPVPVVTPGGETLMPPGVADPHAGHAMHGAADTSHADGHAGHGDEHAGHSAAQHAEHVADGTHARHIADGTAAHHHADGTHAEHRGHAEGGHAEGGHAEAGHGAMGHGAHGHEGMTAMDHAGMPGMLSATQLDALRAARGVDFDRLFLRYMIQHHGGAIVMVDDLIVQDGAVQDEQSFRLAADVRVDQITEIARMQAMLDALGDD